MNLATLAFHRARARAGVLGVIAAVTMLATVALSGALAYLTVESTDAVRESLADRPADERLLSYQTRLHTDDPAAQDDAAREVMEPSVAPAPVVRTAIITAPLDLHGSDEERLTLRAELPGTGDSPQQHVEVLAGTWPEADGEAALDSVTASMLDLGVGDTVQLGPDSHAVTVTALWQPSDAQHPFWSGGPILGGGAESGAAEAYGPLFVTFETLTSLNSDPFIRWVVSTPEQFGPDDVLPWATASAGWQDALDDAGVSLRGLTAHGTLPESLTEVDSALAAVSSASLIPLVIISILAVVATWQLAYLLSVLRRRESVVLASRGSSRRALVAMVIAESLVVIAPAVCVVAVGLWLIGRPRDGFDGTQLALSAAGVGLALLAVLIAVGVAAVRDPLRAEDASGRSAAPIAAGAVVLSVAAAAFTMWRLRLNAGPLLGGTGSPDPFAIAAPGIALLSAAVIAIAVATPATRLAERVAARGRGFSPVSEVRQVSRQISINAVPVMLIVLATATSVLAASYAGTWHSLRAMSAQVEGGADVRAVLGTARIGPEPRNIRAYGEIDGVHGATGVVQAPVAIDGESGLVTAATAQAWQLSPAPADVLDPISSAPLATDGALEGPELPDGTQVLAIELEAASELDDGPPEQDIAVRAWLWNGQELSSADAGIVTTVGGIDDDGASPAGHGQAVAAELPIELTGGSWRLVGLELELPLYQGSESRYHVEFTSISADGEELSDHFAGWQAVQLPPTAAGDVVESDGTLGVQVQADSPAGSVSDAVVRLMPPGPGPGSIPAVTTPGWSDVVLPGGTAARFGTTTVTLASVGTVPVIPGNSAAAAAVVDLPTLYDALLRSSRGQPAATEVWMSSTDAEATAAGAQPLAGERASVQVTADAAPDTLSRPALVVFWAAAGCAILLTLPGIVAVAIAQLSRRRGEVVALRAVGAGARQQSRSRRRELIGICTGAAVAGVLAGAVVCVLVIVDLVRSTTPATLEAVPLATTVSWGGAAVALVALTGAGAAICTWYGARVREQVLDTAWRSEVR